MKKWLFLGVFPGPGCSLTGTPHGTSSPGGLGGRGVWGTGNTWLPQTVVSPPAFWWGKSSGACCNSNSFVWDSLFLLITASGVLLPSCLYFLNVLFLKHCPWHFTVLTDWRLFLKPYCNTQVLQADRHPHFHWVQHHCILLFEVEGSGGGLSLTALSNISLWWKTRNKAG